MIERTDLEIEEKCMQLWPMADGNGWGSRHEAVEIERDGAVIKITVASMYDWDGVPELSFEKRLALSEFFDTMMVETEDEIREGGCETCDYGGRYGFTAVVSPGKHFEPIQAESAA